MLQESRTVTSTRVHGCSISVRRRSIQRKDSRPSRARLTSNRPKEQVNSWLCTELRGPWAPAVRTSCPVSRCPQAKPKFTGTHPERLARSDTQPNLRACPLDTVGPQFADTPASRSTARADPLQQPLPIPLQTQRLGVRGLSSPHTYDPPGRIAPRELGQRPNADMCFPRCQWFSSMRPLSTSKFSNRLYSSFHMVKEFP